MSFIKSHDDCRRCKCCEHCCPCAHCCPDHHLACTHNEGGITRIHHAPQPHSHDQCEEIKRLRLLNSTLLARPLNQLPPNQLPHPIPIPPQGYGAHTKLVEKKDIHVDHDGSSVPKENKESFNLEQLEFLLRLKTNHGVPPKDSKPPFTPRQIEELRSMGIMKDRPVFNTMQMGILQLMSPDPAPPQQHSALPQAPYPNKHPNLGPHAPGKTFPGRPNVRRRMTHPPQIYQPQNNSLHHNNVSPNPPQQSHRNDPNWTHPPTAEYGRGSGLPIGVNGHYLAMPPTSTTPHAEHNNNGQNGHHENNHKKAMAVNNIKLEH